MTRALSTLLSGVADGDITGALINNALPTVRTYFLTATNGANQPLLYTLLTDLDSTTTASSVEGTLDALFEEATLADAIRSVAARLASISLLSANFPTLAGLEKINARQEKTAMAELDRITKSPQLKTAAAAVLATASAANKITGTTLLTLALDANAGALNLTTKIVPAYTGAQLPYSGAPEAGKLGMILDGQAVEVTVAAGDTPAHTLDALMKAFELLPSTSKPNASLIVNEKIGLGGTPSLTYADPQSGNPRTDTFSVTANGATLGLVPRDYDAKLQVAAATFYLTSRDPNNHSVFVPGLRGFRYGVTTRWNDLTLLGPHAVTANLTQGKSTSLSSTTAKANAKAPALSDAFYFQVTTDTGATAADGVLTYQVNALPPVMVPISAGTSALEVASRFARSLAALAETQRVIGAVRPPLTAAPSGSGVNAPSLELVSYALETVLTSLVVSLKNVPAGVTFAVCAHSTLTDALFDAKEKSVVIHTTVNKPKISGSAAVVTNPNLQGGVVNVVHVPSAALSKLLTNFTRSR